MVCQLAEAPENTKTVLVKSTPGDLPLPWSEKDPYRLPASIDKVQRLLMGFGERPERGGGMGRRGRRTAFVRLLWCSTSLDVARLTDSVAWR